MPLAFVFSCINPVHILTTCFHVMHYSIVFTSVLSSKHSCSKILSLFKLVILLLLLLIIVVVLMVLILLVVLMVTASVV